MACYLKDEVWLGHILQYSRIVLALCSELTPGGTQENMCAVWGLIWVSRMQGKYLVLVLTLQSHRCKYDTTRKQIYLTS